MKILNKRDVISYYVIYDEFMYKDSSWDKEHRVVVKIENTEGQMLSNFNLLVAQTSLSSGDEVRFYCSKGTMVNFVKEGKIGLPFDK